MWDILKMQTNCCCMQITHFEICCQSNIFTLLQQVASHHRVVNHIPIIMHSTVCFYLYIMTVANSVKIYDVQCHTVPISHITPLLKLPWHLFLSCLCPIHGPFHFTYYGNHNPIRIKKQRITTSIWKDWRNPTWWELIFNLNKSGCVNLLIFHSICKNKTS